MDIKYILLIGLLVQIFDMKRIVNIAKDQDEAYKWDIKQAINMSVEERQQAALELKNRVYGEKPDIREWERKKR